MIETLLFSSVFCVLLLVTQQCTSNGYPFESYLATRTPYRTVSNKSFSQIKYEGCEPKKIWMIVRHGTRNPSEGNIQKIRNRLPEIKEMILDSSSLPNEFIKNRDLDLFRKWKTSLDLSDEQKLTHEGEEEMLLLAERMQSRFPKIFDNVYSNSSYKFKYTYSQRTKKSAYYFAAGLFGKQTARDVWFPEPLKKDPILRFYKLCNKWNSQIKKQVKLNGEQKEFEGSPEMKAVLQEVTERLSLEKNALDTGDLFTMYIACGFETAWHKKSKSPWCTPFSVENLKVLEYLEDLKYYWQDGYGHELTYKQACPVFGDMMNFFETKEPLPKSTIYFTHSGTLLKILAHVGLYQEKEHLTAENYETMKDRNWKTSLIDSFGTNLAFVLFSCGDEEKILTLHQENIVKLPACPENELCEIKKMNEFYNQSIKSCDFNSMCENA